MNGTLQAIALRASDFAARISAEAQRLDGAEATTYTHGPLLVLALVAGLGGLCAWGLSMRRRRIRAAALEEVRRSLHLLIGTQTSALLTLHSIAADDEERARIEGAADSMNLVDHLVCSLSEESLSSSAGNPRVRWTMSDVRETAPLLDFRRN